MTSVLNVTPSTIESSIAQSSSSGSRRNFESSLHTGAPDQGLLFSIAPNPTVWGTPHTLNQAAFHPEGFIDSPAHSYQHDSVCGVEFSYGGSVHSKVDSAIGGTLIPHASYRDPSVNHTRHPDDHVLPLIGLDHSIDSYHPNDHPYKNPTIQPRFDLGRLVEEDVDRHFLYGIKEEGHGGQSEL